MQTRTSQTLYAYWNEIRAGRIAPRRLEIEPSRISSVLPETFMLERIDASAYRFRLAGTRMCEIFGVELRDADMLDGWSASDRAVLAHSLASTCAQGAVTLFVVEATSRAPHRVQLEAILLPLTHGEGITRLIGAMAPIASPHWLGYERLTHKQLVRHETIWPDGRPHALVQRAGSRAPLHSPLVKELPQGALDPRRRFRVFDGGRSTR
jgi:hypothetical protein